MNYVIELRNVSKTYKMDETKVQALKKINLKVRKSEFLAIMGPSGSGKSTLLHIMGCLDRPTKGKVIVDGLDATKFDDTELARLRGLKIGFVFQFFNLYPTLTALENVELPMAIAEKNKEERIKRAIELLELVGMGSRANHLPSQLSGGERQRVAIARSLANDPAVILADEPTGNLDSKTGREIVLLLKKLQNQGKTIVMVTHEKSMAIYADRIVYLKDGQIEKEVVV